MLINITQEILNGGEGGLLPPVSSSKRLSQIYFFNLCTPLRLAKENFINTRWTNAENTKNKLSSINSALYRDTYNFSDGIVEGKLCLMGKPGER